ncbi:MAG TPA: 30S ribosomal protein S3 [Candidatus Bathyarchaeota archaeon]|nr:MAG: 30S ribosomal protein S3 [Candidatus Bathyarchaeota archaeon]HDO81774.1 30S ribosomal protein S3 [Candidatus Bathyarchaeota archaeon]HEW89886.1 30S ribosomal protein S3 [Candidatus Bathyarchaeota archaeon]
MVKQIIKEALLKLEIDEYLRKRFDKAGYGGVSITKTPLGTQVVIYATRPGLIIGRGGQVIKKLTEELRDKFGLENPQISVAEVEVPELNPHIMASRIAYVLRKGVHYRRAGFWALRRIMEAGALGAEIVISGKLRTARARYEKFRAGYLPTSGDPAQKYLRKAVVHVQLKPGIFGIKVTIMPPDARFPDKLEVKEPEEVEAELLAEAVPEIKGEEGGG